MQTVGVTLPGRARNAVSRNPGDLKPQVRPAEAPGAHARTGRRSDFSFGEAAQGDGSHGLAAQIARIRPRAAGSEVNTNSNAGGALTVGPGIAK